MCEAALDWGNQVAVREMFQARLAGAVDGIPEGLDLSMKLLGRVFFADLALLSVDDLSVCVGVARNTYFDGIGCRAHLRAQRANSGTIEAGEDRGHERHCHYTVRVADRGGYRGDAVIRTVAHFVIKDVDGCQFGVCARQLRGDLVDLAIGGECPQGCVDAQVVAGETFNDEAALPNLS